MRVQAVNDSFDLWLVVKAMDNDGARLHYCMPLTWQARQPLSIAGYKWR